MSYENKIPCGKVLGHGESCCEGHLCGACAEILRLRKQVKGKGDNGEKKPIPEFREEYKDAFIYVMMDLIARLSGKEPVICIKPEALDNMPDKDRPIFVWNNNKGHWAVMIPKKVESKIVTPDKRLIVPNEN